MKLEKLTEKKFRIIINIDEFEEKNFKINNLLQNPNLTQKFLFYILKNVEKKWGLSLANYRFIVDFFVFEENFLILTFTKIDFNNFELRKHAILKNKSLLYKFKNFDDFCEFVTYISNITDLNNFPKHIKLYEYNNIYYLYIPNISCNKPQIFISSLLEFAQLVNNKDFINYKLFEYGNIIFKNNALKEYINHFS